MNCNLDIIIPTYNDCNTLSITLDRLHEQKFTGRVYIIDDCSTDDTQSLECKKKSYGFEVYYHRMEYNSGPGLCRNKGVEISSNKYFTFLDSDDFISTVYTQELTKIASLDVDLAITSYHLSWNKELKYTYCMHAVDAVIYDSFSKSEKILVTRKDITKLLGLTNFPWNKVYSRSLWEKEDIMFPDLRLNEDIFPHWNIIDKSKKVYFDYAAPPILTHFEIDGADRATNQVSHHRLRVYKELQKLHIKLIQESDDSTKNEFNKFYKTLDTWMLSKIPEHSHFRQDAEFKSARNYLNKKTA